MIGMLLSELWPYLAGAVLMFLGAAGLYRKGRRDVAQKRDLDAARTTIKQEAKGRDAVSQEKRAVEGIDSSGIVDRLRRRDGDWRGM